MMPHADPFSELVARAWLAVRGWRRRRLMARIRRHLVANGWEPWVVATMKDGLIDEALHEAALLHRIDCWNAEVARERNRRLVGL